MRFNKHWEVEGQHAFLGASKHHWINYDLEKMKRIWENQFKSRRGSRLHDLAKILIKEKIRLERNNLTFNAYVNDAIGYRMEPEIVLKFSDNTFGTTDAIQFYPDEMRLRVHDLKTGTHPGSFHQTEVYCALFCHEYKFNPHDIEMIMRIYQNDQIFEHVANPNEIERIIEKMKEFEPEIEKMKEVML